MTMQDLIEKLKLRPKGDGWQEELLDWQRGVRALFEKIVRWLAPAESAGVLALHQTEFLTDAPGFGVFSALRMEIRDGRVTVRLQPGGIHATDAHDLAVKTGGQIDMTCGPYRVPLVRGAGASTDWWIVPPSRPPEPLTEDAFARVLSEILVDE